MDKKAISKFLMIITAVPMIILAAMMGTIGLFEIGEEFIIDDISNVTQTIAQDTNVSSVYVTKMQEAESNYDNTKLPFDLLFAMIFLGAFVASVSIASKASPMPTYSFLGVVSIGLMFVLFVLTFLDQFISWFIDDFFYKLFNGATQNTPFLDWYLGNLSMINIVWLSILLFLNQVEIDITTIFKRNKKQDNTGGSFEE